jgi:hypothetical protein
MSYRSAGLRILMGLAVLWSAYWGWACYEAAGLADEKGGARYFGGRLMDPEEFRREQVHLRDRSGRFATVGLAVLLALLLGLKLTRRHGDD